MRALRDLRLLPSACLVWLLTGLGQDAPGIVLALLGAAGAVIATGTLLWLLRRGAPGPRPRVGPAAAVPGQLAVLGALTTLAAAALWFHSPATIPEEAGRYAYTVTGPAVPSRSGDFLLVPVAVPDAVPGRGAGARLVLPADASPPPQGSRWAAVLSPSHTDTGTYLGAPRDAELVRAAPAWSAARERIRAGLRAAASAGPVPETGAGLLPGLVLGDTSAQPPGLTDDMRMVSMTHLTAVSGSNLAIVTGAAWYAGAWLALGRRLRVAAALVAMGAYCYLVGPEPSVLRASAMATAVLAGILRGSGGTGLPLLFGAIVVLLLVAPGLAGEYAFILSVLACAGIMTLALPLARRRPAWLPEPVALALAVPLTAQLACTPVLVLLQPQLSLWAVPANIAASAAVAPATVLGVVAVIAGLIPGAGAVLAVVAACPAAWCAAWIAGCAHLFAGLPLAAVPWPEGAPGAGLALGLVAVLVTALLAAMTRWRLLAVVLLVGGLLGASITADLVRPARWLAPGWSMVVCDVGQGSAALVATGRREALLLDAGPDPLAVDACLRQAGVDRVAVYLSHFDQDHIGGLEGVLRGRELLALRTGPAGAPRPETLEIGRLAREAGVVPQVGLAGASWQHGAVTVEALWPRRSAAVPPESIFHDPQDPAVSRTTAPGSAESRPGAPAGRHDEQANNPDSLVLRVALPGATLMAPGDITAAEQARLAAEVAPVDVLLAPHHGSGDLDEGFYRAADAGTGIVSAGEGNRYGHPTQRALDSLGTASILRTDTCGSIALYLPQRQAVPAASPPMAAATERRCHP
ncbi:ComEC/Rec2 family competence protein [Sediminivirga luteola]|uniref:ComEC/Rec2 family competence protein n=1 Tax=Sediminivirga luteola TaxID=1774748 RepID=UPI001F5AEB6B|nr:ComEC/Rec2 family competence protein [Sediminivirga luteola]MCI2264211.1 ComEC/Rec2 family competence protein [Sediminivirga luteola]